MRAILEVLTGSRQGHRVALGAGRTLTIGRSHWSEFAFKDDTKMSRVHLRVETDENGCYMYDGGKLGERSSNGTSVNGVVIEKCLLRSGDKILAGRTLFKIEVWDDDPIRARESRQLQEVPQDVDSVIVRVQSKKQKVVYSSEKCGSGLTLFRGDVLEITPYGLARNIQQKIPLHMLVDPQRLDAAAFTSTIPANYLFDWMPPEALATTSPVLVSPDVNDRDPVALLKQAWGHDAVICFFSKLPAKEVLEHLRERCRPRMGASAMLGVCWPSVLAPMLQHFTPSVVNDLMEGIEAILVEFPDLEEKWQVFGNKNVEKLFNEFGFAPETPTTPTMTSEPGMLTKKTDPDIRYRPEE